MSTTRTTCSIPKNLNALTTGAKIGASAAGVTSMSMSVLGAFLVISSPATLGITGGVGLLFCCIGGGYELCRSDQNEPRPEREEKRSTATRMVSNRGMFSITTRSEVDVYVRSPASMTMDETKESKELVMRK